MRQELEGSGELAVQSAKTEIAEEIYLWMKRKKADPGRYCAEIGQEPRLCNDILQGPCWVNESTLWPAFQERSIARRKSGCAQLGWYNTRHWDKASQTS